MKKLLAALAALALSFTPAFPANVVQLNVTVPGSGTAFDFGSDGTNDFGLTGIYGIGGDHQADVNTDGGLDVHVINSPADSLLSTTGTLSAADAAMTSSTGANGQVIWTGTPTANSTLQFPAWSGAQSGLLVCTGTFSATLEFDALTDNASPGHYVQQSIQLLLGQSGNPTNTASFTTPIIGTVNLTGTIGGQIRATTYASNASLVCSLRITTNLSEVAVIGGSTSSSIPTITASTLTLASSTTLYGQNVLMANSATAGSVALSSFTVVSPGTYIPSFGLNIADTTSTGPYNASSIQLDIWTSGSISFANGDGGAYAVTAYSGTPFKASYNCTLTQSTSGTTPGAYGGCVPVLGTTVPFPSGTYSWSLKMISGSLTHAASAVVTLSPYGGN